MTNNKILLLILALVFISCRKEEHKPLFTKGEPEPITQYSVENLPGMSKIRFTLTDKNTLYVKAVYTLKDGLTREAKASKYGNELIVDGFAESRDYTVKVYAVSGDEKESVPIDVIVHPLTPPYLAVKQNLKWDPDFGGGYIQAENPSKASLLIGMLTRDSVTGNWVEVTNYYTESQNINFSFRGFPAKETEFALYVRDQWLNYSDTIFKTYAPWEEKMIDMSRLSNSQINNFSLPGDAPTRSGYPKSLMFDGAWANYTQGWYSLGSLIFPVSITIQLPGTFQLSRFRYMQNLNLPYASANPKHIKVWGSLNPNMNGDFDDSWFLLGEYDNWKPSGLPPGQNSDEDLRLATEGNEFTFPRESQAVKYLRIQILSSWQTRDFTYIAELQMWGREIFN